MAKQSRNVDVVIRVHMHCRGCADKVSTCLRGFDGVEEVVIDRENHEVIAKGANVDPLMVLERVQKKHFGNAELISPKITEIEKPEPPPEEPEEIPIKIIVLEVPMHCPQCAVDIRRRLFEIAGVLRVEPNMEEGRVTVKGAVVATALVEHIKRTLGKHSDVVSEMPIEPEKEEKEEVVEQKEKEEEEEEKGMVAYHYPGRCCCGRDFCPCEAFNDENVHSCAIM
ncbi:hypothetical protein MLD38_008493 [Melastoma candidum]|uniref:Uncharacterized protein n=1 Tax=Melastoma candidum TaxID=119954 RepID=A0ACB9RUG2_9MYRT|nr:hypothetical protein MLD38_008493 [Melastoma candidum]